MIQKFQLTNFTNDRIVVSATGVENHQEFVDLVSEKFSLTQLGSTKPQREASQYVGGEIRNFVDSNIAHVAFAFEGNNYQDAYTLLVASEVLGRTIDIIQTLETQLSLEETFLTRMCSLTMSKLSQTVSQTQVFSV